MILLKFEYYNVLNKWKAFKNLNFIWFQSHKFWEKIRQIDI